MVLIPVLLSIGVVCAAIMARLETLNHRRPSPANSAFEQSMDSGRNQGQSPLRAALPHLNLWIPNSEFLRRASTSVDSRLAGPDIMVGPTSTERIPNHHFADAA